MYDKNSQVGLAPASTQKIITAATAFELLGKDYRYKTKFRLKNNNILYIEPGGDSSFGSWRWNNTKTEHILAGLLAALKKLNLKSISETLIDYSGWDNESIPDGWIWQDIGNYYGAGAEKLNWRENQLDVVLTWGPNIGDSVKIKNIDPEIYDISANYFTESKLTAAAPGSGDNAYFYFSLNGEEPNRIRGTIPVNQKEFIISVAAKRPANHFIALLLDTLLYEHKINEGVGFNIVHEKDVRLPDSKDIEIYTHYSPTLDSIIYWFLQKSINLYGEALVKTFAYEKKRIGSTDTGVVMIQQYWKQKGIDEEELNIMDGSGLSPQNRVTTHAQVEILKYAKGKDWFPYFYNALPTYNGMKMKSGSIRDVKGYCGYQKSSDGNDYIFSFLVNNFNGSSQKVVAKMYKVLDVLK